jgi:hypothetical protein
MSPVPVPGLLFIFTANLYLSCCHDVQQNNSRIKYMAYSYSSNLTHFSCLADGKCK